MKKENIDGYEVYSENGEFKKIIFKDYLGNEICISVEQCLKIELLHRRQEGYSEEHKVRKHIDTYIHDDYLFDVRTSKAAESPEDIILAEEKRDRIIQEIWKLPAPQNRRVYMKVVDDFSLTEISKIENRDFAAIKRSIEARIKKVEKKIKKFIIYYQVLRG